MFKAYVTLRNTKVRTWNAEVQPLIAKGVRNDKLLVGLGKLAERAGEYARRLDYLVRTHNEDIVLGVFNSIADKVSNKVLFELYNHFNGRTTEQPRTVFIKGKRKPKVLSTLAPLPKHVVDKIKDSILTALSKKFALKEPMKGLFLLDESLTWYATSQKE